MTDHLMDEKTEAQRGSGTFSILHSEEDNRLGPCHITMSILQMSKLRLGRLGGFLREEHVTETGRGPHF